jgi:hypothetical protein
LRGSSSLLRDENLGIDEEAGAFWLITWRIRFNNIERSPDTNFFENKKVKKNEYIVRHYFNTVEAFAFIVDCSNNDVGSDNKQYRRDSS